ncbi:MAG: twin-arginine translocation signal domain-containing protein [Planctomycetes bacterium]|nr:twin-arginine translocation signal domain-containing protein [Planctomycetota bacterium]MBU4398556.1 twin-arginine translocation signal domain-containing protein [Planctomycetota bacterium]
MSYFPEVSRRGFLRTTAVGAAGAAAAQVIPASALGKDGNTSATASRLSHIRLDYPHLQMRGCRGACITGGMEQTSSAGLPLSRAN